MTLKQLSLIIILAFFTFSCSSDDTPSDPPQNNSLLLKQRVTSYPDDNETMTENFVYDGNVLTSIVNSDGERVDYLYENNLLTRINHVASNGTIEQYVVIGGYDQNTRLSSYTVYLQLNQAFKFELLYNSNGTITEKQYSGDHNSQTTLVRETMITMNNGHLAQEISNDGINYSFEYDTKNGIFKNITHIETLNLINDDFSGHIDSNLNNLVKINDTQNGNTTVSEEFQYTYNSSDYPETATFYLEGTLEKTIQYIYE